MTFGGRLMLIIVTVETTSLPKFCEEVIDPGDDCDLLVRRYAYDANSGRCKRFKFSGCGGNQNNFESMRICTQTCTCFAPRDEGDAVCVRNETTRYYYNPETGKCQTFQYLGCNGNRNNFLTESECKNKCICQRPYDAGECAKISSNRNETVYYFDRRTNRCRKGLYGGCGGNQNRFSTLEQCKEFCVCTMAPMVGPCLAYFPSYFFNKTSHLCETFVYGGCGGNGNRFRLKATCNNTCNY